MVHEHLPTVLAAAGDLNTAGILTFIASKVLPIILGVIGVWIVARAGRGSLSQALNTSVVAIIGLAFIAAAGTLLVVGGALAKLIFE
jgi:hypothetical protein